MLRCCCDVHRTVFFVLALFAVALARLSLSRSRSIVSFICVPVFFIYVPVLSMLGGESCEAAGCDLSSSNELLFSLLSDRLRGIHDAEPFLSSDDAAAFFYVLRSRPRDSKKYPFPFRRGRPMDESRSRPDVSPVFMDVSIRFSVLDFR